MTNIVRRLAASVLGATVLAVPLAVALPEADAATRCTVSGFTPTTVVVGLSPKAVKFAPKVSGCSVGGWTISSDTFFVYEDNPEEVIYPPYDNSDTAPEDVVVSVYNEDYDTTNKVINDGFRLKRNTGWDQFNASPEPVRKGSKITIKGRLRIADWTNDRYVGYTSRTVDVQFRTKTGTYKTVKTATTGSGGYLTTTVTAASDGFWRFRYGGNTIAGGSTIAGDFVDVR